MMGRKFILSLGVLIFGGWVELTNGGVTDGFITLAGLVLGIYSTSNVATKHVTNKKEETS
jgi:hypothetical protein